MSIPLSLSGKVALISGGSRGIGAATVQIFAAAGAKVAFSYRSARSQAETLAKECGAAICHPIASDLGNPEAARALVAETVRHFGQLDILVANHGVWPADDVPIERMSDEQWRSTLSINLDGVFGLVKHAVAQMKGQPRTSAPAGHIVLISSTSGQRGEAFHCDYSATKGALISMTKGLSTQHDSPGARGQAGRDCRARAVLVYRIRQLHHRGSIQRERGRGPDRIGAIRKALKNARRACISSVFCIQRARGAFTAADRKSPRNATILSCA